LVPPQVEHVPPLPEPVDCARAGAALKKTAARMTHENVRKLDMEKPQLKKNGKIQIQYANE
jgi:hypothetical protein